MARIYGFARLRAKPAAPMAYAPARVGAAARLSISGQFDLGHLSMIRLSH